MPPNDEQLTEEEKKAKEDCSRPVSERVQTLDDSKPYAGIIKSDHAKPLSLFLRALGNSTCPQLMFDFLHAPFLTARTAGVPYAAAVILGSGNMEEINAALMAENDHHSKLVAQITGSLGPVWVKAR